MIYFMNKVAEQVNLPSQKNKEQLSSITRPTISDFQNVSWVEAVAPSVDFISNVQQSSKKSNNQPYQNYSTRSENFSFGKFSKQLKFILSGLADTEQALQEETETEHFENDWSAKAKEILEEK